MFGGRRRGIGGRPGGPGRIRARLMFDRALSLLESGQFNEAAAALDELAAAGAARGAPPARVAQVTLQAARAHLGAGRAGEAVTRFQRAVQLFAAGGRPRRAAQAAQLGPAELRARGFTREADALQQELNAQLQQAGVSLAPAMGEGARPPASRSLPARCSSCGAPLRPDEVEWHDAQTAECPYCGTPAKTV
jgi:tetratricopeptide (TPR) repeat protein